VCEREERERERERERRQHNEIHQTIEQKEGRMVI
jgi:hypothetical protein